MKSGAFSVKLVLALALLAIVLITGCNDFVLSELLDGEEGVAGLKSPLTIGPSSITVTVTSALTFSASGGSAPYTFSVISGAGTVNATSGAYTAPVAAGTDVVQVQDSALPIPNTDTATITVSNVATNVDYDITGVTIPGGALAGTTISGTDFDVDNIGSADGSKTIYWNLYASANTVLGPGDELLKTGSTGPLASSGTTNISVTTGNWPASAGNYYIIVTVSAEDDLTTANNIQVTGGQISITLPDVDYDVTVVNNTGGTTAGGPIAGDFTVQNIGAGNGSQTVFWEAYVSTDATLGAGGTFIDSGSTAALNSGMTAGPIGFTGTWPLSAGNHYLIVAVSAADDVSAINDEQDNGGTAVTGGPAPDYEISATNLPANGTSGLALSVPHNFDIDNLTPNPGTQSIDWVVYASLDQVLDGGDTMIASGSTGP